MNLTIENYISPIAPEAASARRVGLFVWLAVLLFLLLWIGTIISAPLAMSNGLFALAKTIYLPFGYICHQIDERSFHLFGYKLAVCARCFGIYAGLAIGALIYPIIYSLNNTLPPPRVWLFLAPLPTAIDWSLGIFGIWQNTHASRFATGWMMGFALVFFIIPGLVDISQHLFRQKSKKISAQPRQTAKVSHAPSDYSQPDLRI